MKNDTKLLEDAKSLNKVLMLQDVVCIQQMGAIRVPETPERFQRRHVKESAFEVTVFAFTELVLVDCGLKLEFCDTELLEHDYAVVQSTFRAIYQVDGAPLDVARARALLGFAHFTAVSQVWPYLRSELAMAAARIRLTPHTLRSRMAGDDAPTFQGVYFEGKRVSKKQSKRLA